MITMVTVVTCRDEPVLVAGTTKGDLADRKESGDLGDPYDQSEFNDSADGAAYGRA